MARMSIYSQTAGWQAVIGITDYRSIRGYEECLPSQKAGSYIKYFADNHEIFYY